MYIHIFIKGNGDRLAITALNEKFVWTLLLGKVIFVNIVFVMEARLWVECFRHYERTLLETRPRPRQVRAPVLGHQVCELRDAMSADESGAGFAAKGTCDVIVLGAHEKGSREWEAPGNTHC